MCFGYSKELSHWDGSFEYPQHMFWLRIKKNNFQLRTLICGPVTTMSSSYLHLSLVLNLSLYVYHLTTMCSSYLHYHTQWIYHTFLILHNAFILSSHSFYQDAHIISLHHSNCFRNTVKLVLSGHSKKKDKTMVLKPCGSLIKVKSTAECSTGAFCNTSDLH